MDNLDTKDKISLCQSTSVAEEWCMKMKSYLVSWDDLYDSILSEDVEVVKYLIHNFDHLSTLDSQEINYLLYEASETDNFEIIKMFLEYDRLDIVDYLSSYRLALDSDVFDDYAVEILDLVLKKIPYREDIGIWYPMKDIIEHLGYLDSKDDIRVVFNMIRDKYRLEFEINELDDTIILDGEEYTFWGKNGFVVRKLVFEI